MIGKIVLLATVAMASANTFHGVDPDTLSCDPDGQVFLNLPDFTECNKFFMCDHGKEVPFKCPDGLWFDFAIQVCNWPSDTRCVLRTPKVESEEVEVIGSDEGSGDGGSGWDENFIIQAGSLSVPVVDTAEAIRADIHKLSDQGVSQLNCAVAQLSTKLAAYRGDCQRYWRCNNGVAEAAFCSDGLYFNQRTFACDYEANVPCARDAQLAQEELGEEFLPF